MEKKESSEVPVFDWCGPNTKWIAGLIGVLAFCTVLFATSKVDSTKLTIDYDHLLKIPVASNYSCEQKIRELTANVNQIVSDSLRRSESYNSMHPIIHFVDLGANIGDSMEMFADRSSVVYKLIFDKWPAERERFESIWNNDNAVSEKAYLFEANPRFKSDLQQVKEKYAGRIDTIVNLPVAVWMEDVESIDFYLDTTSKEHHYWGSSLSSKHNSVTKGGNLTKVAVAAYGLCDYLKRTVKPKKHDIVLLKMDIEGAEYPIVDDMLNGTKRADCLPLIDHFFIEVHSKGQIGSEPPDRAQFKKRLSNAMFGRSYPWQ